jgi:hypothetical protein
VSGYKVPGTKWFLENELTPPSTTAHGTDESIRDKMSSGNPRNWRLQGNQLIADTDFGELSQTIDPAYILVGTDSNNLPVFKKVVS